jgi:hypothetical protein
VQSIIDRMQDHVDQEEFNNKVDQFNADLRTWLEEANSKLKEEIKVL